MKYKIYVLIDPRTDDIRYVGQTIQTLLSRLNKHLNSKDKSHRTNWIKNLKNNNLIPIIKEICCTNDKLECNELEQFYIKKYNDDGYNLVNMTEGGEGSIGFKHNDETKYVMSIKTKERMKDVNTINNLKLKGIEQWNNTSDDDKLLNILNQKNRKNIKQFDLHNNLIKEFLSLRQIEKELGFFRASIKRCLNNQCKSSYGFIWTY